MIRDGTRHLEQEEACCAFHYPDLAKGAILDVRSESLSASLNTSAEQYVNSTCVRNMNIESLS